MRLTMPRSTPAVLLLTGALLVSASGGAVAGTLITGKQIKDGTVTTKDVKNRSLKVQDLSSSAVTALRGAPGPAGPAGPAGAPGADGLVHAYARINGTSVTSSSGGITVTDGATPGFTCVTVEGRNSQLFPAVVTLDYGADATNDTNQAYAEVATTGSGCGAADFKVVTFIRNAASGAQTFVDQPFFILVP